MQQGYQAICTFRVKNAVYSLSLSIPYSSDSKVYISMLYFLLVSIKFLQYRLGEILSMAILRC